MKKIVVAAVGFIILILIGGYVFLNQQKPQEKIAQNSSQDATTNQSTSTTQTQCTGEITPSQTEGPYYKSGSPERQNIRDNARGREITVTGVVYDKNCKPIPNAWLDFWQANEQGEYDNTGYTLRGHQFTNEHGVYSLETIEPAAYESRPPHIHVKMRSGNGPIVTSQLYFPGSTQNETDTIFDSRLVVKPSEISSRIVMNFDFVLDH